LYPLPAGAGGARGGAAATVVGSGGNDTLVGSSGDDTFVYLAHAAGQVTVVSSSGADVLDLRRSPQVSYTLTGDPTLGTLTVLRGSAVGTTVQASASPASSVFGQSVTFTATVVPDDSVGTPTGQVHFVDTTTGIDLGTADLTGGSASVVTSALGVGTHVVSASYGGDDLFLPSSGTVTVVVNPLPPKPPTGLAVSPDTGASATDGVTDTGAVTFSGVLDQAGETVEVFDTTAGTDLGPAKVTGASFSLALSLAEGSHRLRALAQNVSGSADASLDVLIDLTPPSSSVAALAAFSLPTFTVSWSGSDSAGGSGLATYDVFVSDDGGAFAPLLTATALTSTSFTGVDGHTYAFYSVATDDAGNRQATPSGGQASTTVDGTPPSSTVAALPPVTYTSAFTVSWSGTDHGGSGITFFDVFVSDDGGSFTRWLAQTALTSATYTGQDGHTYGFYTVATDHVGNVEATPSGAEATTLIKLASPTTTALSTDHPSGSVYGQTITFTALVTAASGNNPTGMVDFVDKTTGLDLGTATLQLVSGVGMEASVSTSGLGAGSHTIEALYTSDDPAFQNSNTEDTGGDVTQAVSKAVLTVTANNASRAYGAANPTFTAAITGFVNGDDSSVVSGSPSLTTSATAASAVGTYTITTALGSLGAANYTFALVNGTLAVVPAVLSAPTLTAFQGLDTGSVTLATFQDVANTSSTFTATINWNDGSPVDKGTVSVNAATGVITVSGHHAYAVDKAQRPTVTLTANGNAALVATATPTVNVSTDVSSQVKATSSGMTYNRATKLYYGSITLQNISSADVTSTGSFRVVLSGLDSRISLTSASYNGQALTFGRDANGNLYIVLPISKLAAGASAKIDLTFSNPLGISFDCKIKTFADEF
jgi:hypothetical protein